MLLTDLPILFLRRLMVDVAVDLLNELAGGVDAVLLLAVIHSRHFDDNSQTGMVKSGMGTPMICVCASSRPSRS